MRTKAGFACVFLDPQDNLKYGFTKYELRRVRRLVRDYYNRASVGGKHLENVARSARR